MENLNSLNSFRNRHIGPRDYEIPEMLRVIGVNSIDELIEQTIPNEIRLESILNLDPPLSENNYLERLREIARENKIYKSYIGMGYYPTILPAVIQRNILENPGWYTQYTPYQAEISQGRLEALINFQQMIMDLTKMEIANASLLDEGTAAAESMIMLFNSRKDKKRNSNKFLVSDECFPQTIDILKTRANPLGIELKICCVNNSELTDDVFGLIVQYPSDNGEVYDYSELFDQAKSKGINIVVSADLLSLALLKPPGEFGADVVVGSNQRFGIPMGYGGPHAGYFATREEFKRLIPGRIIGASIDANGNKAYRMALQTREQHIRREKATSNICTSQVLLAIMSAFYAIYHGPKGIKEIAERIYHSTVILADGLVKLGYDQTNKNFFDTLKIKVDKTLANKIKEIAESKKINFRYFVDGSIGISLNEKTEIEDVEDIISVFAEAKDAKFKLNLDEQTSKSYRIPEKLLRKSEFLTHTVFNSYHSETELMRYIKSLERKDLSLTYSMIPLGSCTMKLNSATEMLGLTWQEFAEIHPFVPIEQAKGYHQIFSELESDLCEITGLDAVNFQPNSGAQGEYTGLMIIRAYHRDNNQSNRNVVLIPASAHGTNPASAVMAGMKVVIVNCDSKGNIDIDDLKIKVEQYSNDLAALMVTYPSTHGVFEKRIKDICKIIHDNGGQVYMDGANMNAQVGLTSPDMIDADVCHLNLHKTFAIPHGGGGPGMGPIVVKKHLIPYLPAHCVVNPKSGKSITAVASAPWGSASILIISHAYIKMLGFEGLKYASEIAILNANYIKSRLEKYFKVLYTGENGRVAHELIFDMREYKLSANIEVEDIAKRLMDYGFHAPTVSFPVPGTLMVEPTESESKQELDRFCDAMISIRNEIKEIEEKIADSLDNVLKNSPHTAEAIVSETWNHKYSREKAVFPTEWTKKNKFWPSVARVNNAYGDRNLVCGCEPTTSYT